MDIWVWEHFESTLEELIITGYNLPTTLHSLAVVKVEHKLDLWKRKLALDLKSSVNNDGPVPSGEKHESSVRLTEISLDNNEECSSPSPEPKPCNTVSTQESELVPLPEVNVNIEKLSIKEENGHSVITRRSGRTKKKKHAGEVANDEPVSAKKPRGRTKQNVVEAEYEETKKKRGGPKTKKKAQTGSNKVKVIAEVVSKDNLDIESDHSESGMFEDVETFGAQDSSRQGKHEEAEKQNMKKSEIIRGRPRKKYDFDMLFNETAPKKEFFCDECNKGFVSKSGLRYHQKIHTTGPLKCPHCDKIYHSTNGFYFHMKIHTNALKCPHCPYVIGNQSWLKRHILQVHKKNDLEAQRCVCNHCGKSYYNLNQLRSHVEARHIRAKTYSCSQCNHVTHRRELLRTHIKNTHTERDLFVCNICGATTRYKQSLLDHQKRHFGEKKFTCDQCPFKGVNTTVLAKHKKKHTERTEMCDICGKAFQTKGHLRRHQVIHTENKEFACIFCTYTCNVQSNLRKHLKNVHRHVTESQTKPVMRIEEISTDIKVNEHEITQASDGTPVNDMSKDDEELTYTHHIDHLSNFEVQNDDKPSSEHHQLLQEGSSDEIPMDQIECVELPLNTPMHSVPNLIALHPVHAIQSSIPSSQSYSTIEASVITEANVGVSHGLTMMYN